MQTLLLTDGSVIVQNQGNTKAWRRLTPDSSGSYVNGTWSNLKQSTTGRLYGPSWVLRDGTVFVAGGEFINNLSTGGDHNTAEIFDPTKNPNANGTPGIGDWFPVPTSPLTAGIGDTGAAMLADGRLLIASYGSSATALFDYTNPSSPWTSGPDLLTVPNGDEASWQLLPDGTILDDMRSPAEKFIPVPAPGTGSWLQIDLPNTTPPIQLRNPDPNINEIGATVLLPNGQVWCIGATGQTAYYTPGASPSDPGFFQPGPLLPSGDVDRDAPASLMPNGKVLLVTQDSATLAPRFREFDWRVQDQSTGLMGVFNTVSGPSNLNQTFTNPSAFRFLNLPSGEILFTNGQVNSGWTYYSDDPGQGASADWRPQIYSILGGWTFNPPLADGVYRLSGTQLNGLSYGSSYGDEGQSATNWPVIELRSRTTGQLFFARTFNFSTMGVATGNSLQTADFTLPVNFPPDEYDVFVEANGTSSDAFGFYQEVITESPWGVSPTALPGREEAENFDFGGNSVAYNVGAPQGSDNYRSTSMNIVPTTDTGGGWEVDSLRAGEWINYTVNKLAYGPQSLAVRVSSAVSTSKFHFESITSIVQDYPRIVTTEAITPSITVPNTGGAGHWQTLMVPISPDLSTVEQTVRLVVDTAGVNFNWFSVTPTPPNGVVGAPSIPGVTLSWFISPGATSFNIYRSTTSGAEGTTPYKTGVTNNTFTDTAVTNGTTYFYTVAALTADGATSLTSGGPIVQSSEAAVTPSGPPAPTGVTPSASDGQVELSWNPSAGAIYYNVFRGTSPGGEGATPILTYQYNTDIFDAGRTDGTTYYYKVVAVSSTGTSNKSAEVSGKPIAAPPVPTNVTATGGTNKITVTWTAAPTATAYNVYRSTSPGLNNIENVAPTITGTTFVDTNVVNGTTYYYSVTALNGPGNGQESDFSAQASAMPGTAAPNPPTNLAATAGIGKLSLSWTASSGATSYNLYRGTAAGMESATALNTTAITTTSYVDTTGTVGTKYYYKATAVAGGVESTTKSNETSATPTAAAAPTNLAATAGAGKVTLTWTASTGATGYYVYRGTATGQESATALNTSAITTTTYVDTTVTPGTKYYYKAAALPGTGTLAKSNEASATPTGAPPNPPTGLTATPGVGQMSLSWTASTGATSYKIYRSTTAGNETLVTTPTITGTTYVDVPIIAGTKYYYKATAVGAGGESTTKSNEASATPTANTGIKINAGGPAASPFVADIDFDNSGSVNHTNTIDVSGVTNPAPAAVYQSAHTTTTATPFTYTIPGFVPGSSHTVRLHFCETYFNSAQQRVFDVTLNGAVVLPMFDIWVQAGNKQNKAVAKSFTVNANSNGAYIITFTKDTNSAWVSGIEVN